MKQIIDVAIPVMVIYVMFVVGLSLTWADFARLRQSSVAILLGSLGPFLILPIFAVTLVVLLELPPYIEAGILLISICPGGGISNFYTYLAKASTALSISMTGVSSILAIIMMPALMFAMVMLDLGAQVFAVPILDLMRQLLLTLIVPIVAGMSVRHRFTEYAIGNEKLFRLSSIAIILCLTIFILVSGPASSFQEWIQIALFSILLSFFAMGSGFLVGYLARLNRSDRFTLMIEYA
ncbi:bile acid:sodium symporter, partial [Gammaproteobacteria bacterium]|nr:bile acid:sodium symporter [Gammaproteobacteria bacterium]